MSAETFVEYERIKGGIGWRFDEPAAPGGRLMFYATEIRKIGRDDPKLTAYIRIGFPGSKAIVADDLRLRDSEARGRLANKAAAALWKVTRTNEKAEVMAERMLEFCDGLWDAWVGSDAGGLVHGDDAPTAPLWAVPGLILSGATGIHFGNAKAGKSTVDRLLAVSIQNGVTTLFPNLLPGNVIWVNAEEPPAEHSRQIGNVNQVLGLDRRTPLYTLDARGVSIHDLAPRLAMAVEQTKAQHIFIDSLSRLAQGMSLNDNSTATGIIDSVAGLGPSVTWIGHTGQSNQHRLAGSKHFENAARLLVRVQGRVSQGQRGHLQRGVRADVTVANGAASPIPTYLTLGYHEQYGIEEAWRSSEHDWPMLQCEYVSGNERQCSTRTWDGMSDEGPRCPKHRWDGSDA